MSAPDYYEQYLLGLAVEAGGSTFRIYRAPTDGWTTVGTSGPSGYSDGRDGTGPTLEAALRALLDDLGVEYEERPSAERVAEFSEAMENDEGGDLRVMRGRFSYEPLTVLALLAGDQ